MRIDIVSIFPQYLDPLSLSLVGKAREAGIVSIGVHDLRTWSADKHHRVDDTPYGGGPGMVMQPEVWGAALDHVRSLHSDKPLLVIPTPSGYTFTHGMAQEWSTHQGLVFACGRYEGIDARVAQHYSQAPDWRGVAEISIGDYVLAGGEAATLVMVEAVARLIPGVLGNDDSAVDDSFAQDPELVEGPVYTKPPQWRGLDVPEVLLSGHHARIEAWRRDQAAQRSQQVRGGRPGGPPPP